MNFKFSILLLTVFLAGCFDTKTSNDEITAVKPELSEDKVTLRNRFIGKWYSEQSTNEGGLRRTTVERLPDSRYLIIFLITTVPQPA